MVNGLIQNDPISSQVDNPLPIFEMHSPRTFPGSYPPPQLNEPLQLLAAFFGTSTVGLAICDRRLRYVAINGALAKMNGVPSRYHIGKSVRQILGKDARLLEKPMHRVISTGEPLLNYPVRLMLPTRREAGYWIENYFPIRDSTGKVQQVGVIVVEITNEKLLEGRLRELNHELVRVLDDTQRRIARELHDTLNQYHIGIKLHLGAIGHRRDLAPEVAESVKAAIALLDKSVSTTRTFSHLLHPGNLEAEGFETAARKFVEEFSLFSGINVNLRIVQRARRLSPRAETVLFRVLQEALTNVQRHADASRVHVRTSAAASRVSLVVKDFGKGMSARIIRNFRDGRVNEGLGLKIMRERLQEIGGQLQILSNGCGTTLKATVPNSTDALRYLND